MYCSNCGSDVVGMKFCKSCGQAVVVVTETQVVVPSPWGPPAAQMTSISTMQSMEPYVPPRVAFGEAIKLGFKGYVVWNARSTRAEFWWWSLFSFLVLLGALAIDAVLTGGLLYFAAVIGLFLPGLSVFVRRLHDIDKNGGWYWIGLIPIVGGIILLVFVLTPSQPFATRWNKCWAREAGL